MFPEIVYQMFVIPPLIGLYIWSFRCWQRDRAIAGLEKRQREWEKAQKIEAEEKAAASAEEKADGKWLRLMLQLEGDQKRRQTAAAAKIEAENVMELMLQLEGDQKEWEKEAAYKIEAEAAYKIEAYASDQRFASIEAKELETKAAKILALRAEVARQRALVK